MINVLQAHHNFHINLIIHRVSLYKIDFMVFLQAGATYCTGGCEIWRGGVGRICVGSTMGKYTNFLF